MTIGEFKALKDWQFQLKNEDEAKDVELIFHTNYYDGPLCGLCWHNNRIHYYQFIDELWGSYEEPLKGSDDYQCRKSYAQRVFHDDLDNNPGRTGTYEEYIKRLDLEKEYERRFYYLLAEIDNHIVETYLWWNLIWCRLWGKHCNYPERSNGIRYRRTKLHNLIIEEYGSIEAARQTIIGQSKLDQFLCPENYNVVGWFNSYTTSKKPLK